MTLHTRWGLNRPGKPFSHNATDDGTVGGLANIRADYSAAPKDFWVQPPAGTNYHAVAATLYLSLTNARDKGQYGQITAPGLINGLRFIYKRGEVEVPISPALKTNQSLVTNGWRSLFSELNGNSDLFVFEFLFLEKFGIYQALHSGADDKFILRVQDDFSALDVHCLVLTGIREDVTP